MTRSLLTSFVLSCVHSAYYYHLFDTVVNTFLIDRCRSHDPAPQSLAFVVASGCTYLRPLGFPAPVLAGLATEHVGRSSVRWRLGLWPASSLPKSSEQDKIMSVMYERDDKTGCAAFGYFTHVFVHPDTRSSVAMSAMVRTGASSILCTERPSMSQPSDGKRSSGT